MVSDVIANDLTVNQKYLMQAALVSHYILFILSCQKGGESDHVSEFIENRRSSSIKELYRTEFQF